MKTEITFTPANDLRHPDKTPFAPIKALQVSYGLVIHPAVSISIRIRRGYWDVSDPLTGTLVAYGVYPGPEGAVAGLVEKAMQLKNRPGGFRGALERARAKLRAAPHQFGGEMRNG